MFFAGKRTIVDIAVEGHLEEIVANKAREFFAKNQSPVNSVKH